MGYPPCNLPPCRHPLGLHQVSQVVEYYHHPKVIPFVVLKGGKADHDSQGLPSHLQLNLFLKGVIVGVVQFPYKSPYQF